MKWCLPAVALIITLCFHSLIFKQGSSGSGGSSGSSVSRDTVKIMICYRYYRDRKAKLFCVFHISSFTLNREVVDQVAVAVVDQVAVAVDQVAVAVVLVQPVREAVVEAAAVEEEEEMELWAQT